MKYGCNWYKCPQRLVLAAVLILVLPLLCCLLITGTWQGYEKALARQAEGNLDVPYAQDGLDKDMWRDGRSKKPHRTNGSLVIHPLEFSGREWTDKVAEVWQKLVEEGADVLFLTALDEIAWLLNLRGFCDDKSPLFYSYVMMTKQEIRLYMRNVTRLLSPDIQTHLRVTPDGTCPAGTSWDSSKSQPRTSHCVSVCEYETALSELEDLRRDSAISSIWMAPDSQPAVFEAAGEKRYAVTSPVQLMKAVKNDVERSRYAQCQVRDSAVLVEFAATLEQKISSGEAVTELEAANLLLRLRRQDEYYYTESFPAISAAGHHAAVVHYTATRDSHTRVTAQHIYLIDSGGQYLDGTTDVTRTFHFGTPTRQQMEAYTRVLIGHMELAMTVWPEGTRGSDIDVRARSKLWQYGWDYPHDTGHGVGYFTTVHEGPGRIARGYKPGDFPLYAGMFISDEPGFYLAGEFGVRLESILAVEVADTQNRFKNKTFLSFRAVTLVPFEPKLINFDLLNGEHRKWLNVYNVRCRAETGDRLLKAGKTQAYNWLLSRTEHIPDQPHWAVGAATQLHHINITNLTIFQLITLCVLYNCSDIIN